MLVKIAENYQLNYQLIKGDKSKPYLIFLHEGLGSVKMWKGFPERLCQLTGCPGLVYDRLGYGESSALIDQRSIHYLHQAAMWELPKLLSTVIPQKPYILIGHSDGGSISLIHAAEQPEWLVGIITEAAHVFVEPETLSGIQKALNAYKKGKLKGLENIMGLKQHKFSMLG